MSPQPKPHALYGLSLMGGVLVGGKSFKMDMLGIRYEVIKLELIQERDSIMVQGFKEAKQSLRKAPEIKVQDLGF